MCCWVFIAQDKYFIERRIRRDSASIKYNIQYLNKSSKATFVIPFYLYKCFQIIAEIMNQFCHVGVKFLISDNISQYSKFWEHWRYKKLSSLCFWKLEKRAFYNNRYSYCFFIFSVLFNLFYMYSLIITRHNVKLEKNSF